jgi:glycosyltransferase involved in cell wall biosynthesis
MKVLHITSRYFPNIGGVELFTQELCERLAAKGLKVTVYSLDFNERSCKKELINGVLVRRYKPLFGNPLFIPSISFFNDLRKEGKAILHLHNIQNLFPLLLSLAKTRNQQLVIQPHYHRFGQTPMWNIFFSLYKVVIPKIVLNRARIVIANSKYEMSILIKDFDSKNIKLVPEGLSLAELRSVKLKPKYPESILYVGGLRAYKRVDSLMEAFKIIMNLEKKPMKLIIVGDGPDINRLKDLAKNLGIEKSVEWKRNLSRSQLLSEYSQAKVLVSLSSLESFSRVVYEAYEVGLPIVVADKEVFSDLVDERSVEVGTLQPKCIAKAILLAIEKGPRTPESTSPHSVDLDEYATQIAKIYLALWRLNN